MKSNLWIVLLFLCNCTAMVTRVEPVKPAPRVPLWESAAPLAQEGEDRESDPILPTLDLYPVSAESSVGTAVVVCPGGGYGGLAMGHEGRDIAAWFNQLGVHAFVLRYRHAPRYSHPVPLTDVRRAVRWVRSQADRFGFRSDRVGIMGFSAGGHLTSTALTQFEAGRPDAQDPIERVGSRPDFGILCYPVITMGEKTHQGSKRNLIGKNPDPDLVNAMSSEKRVTQETPPCFIFHTTDDGAVPVENALLFFSALREHGVPAELHVYAHGRHGVGLAPKDPVLSSWPDRLKDWLKGLSVLDRPVNP